MFLLHENCENHHRLLSVLSGIAIFLNKSLLRNKWLLMNLCDFHLTSYELRSMGSPSVPCFLAPLQLHGAVQVVLAMKCEQK